MIQTYFHINKSLNYLAPLSLGSFINALFTSEILAYINMTIATVSLAFIIAIVFGKKESFENRTKSKRSKEGDSYELIRILRPSIAFTAPFILSAGIEQYFLFIGFYIWLGLCCITIGSECIEASRAIAHSPSVTQYSPADSFELRVLQLPLYTHPKPKVEEFNTEFPQKYSTPAA